MFTNTYLLTLELINLDNNIYHFYMWYLNKNI